MIASALPHDLAHVPLTTYKRYSEKEMVRRSQEFFKEMDSRRTLRYYSSEDVPKEVIENIIRTGGKDRRLCKLKISKLLELNLISRH
jgi:hypothetical protein